MGIPKFSISQFGNQFTNKGKRSVHWIEGLRKKLKKTKRNGKTFHAQGLEELKEENEGIMIAYQRKVKKKKFFK